MALISPTNPAVTGTVVTGTAASASDTISGSMVGGYLVVTNASGGSVNVTPADPGRTPMGNTGTNPAIAVAAGVTKAIKLTAGMVASNNLITVACSAPTDVSYVLYPPTTV